MSTTQILASIGIAVLLVGYLFWDQIYWPLRLKVGDALAAKRARKHSQALMVHLPWQEIPSEAHDRFDIYALQEDLRKVIKRKRLGVFDGNELSSEEAVLFMYGADAEALFSGIESLLRSNPLCKNARIVIRRGLTEGPERVVLLD